MKFTSQVGCHAAFDTEFIELIGSDDAGDERISIRFSPEKGCNLFSLKVEGIEYLFEKIEYQGNLMLLGIPILYPFPNRMRDARFSFDGIDYTFEPNSGDLLLHGLVTNSPWETSEPFEVSDGISVKNQIVFDMDTSLYAQYPIRQKLELVYTLKEDRVSLTFTVTNLDEDRRLPFGLGIHPYFNLISPRESIKIQVPAKKWMEAENLMPSGKLIPLEDAPGDMREPVALSALNLDDVFWGMTPEHPMQIFFEESGKCVTFKASEIFTHACIFCPPQLPFFCMENQTCSADAHNLYSKGYEDEAHLLILDPGESQVGTIEIILSNI